jgi:hypothetical protein
LPLGFVTFVATKVTKKRLSAERLPNRTGLCAANQAIPIVIGTGLQKFSPLRSHRPFLPQSLLSPAAAQATIVLPDFARSCSADGEEEY